jgi:hypothetical protein
VDIHAEIDIRNQKSPAKPLKLVSGRKAVHATDHDVASPQQVAMLLPTSNNLNIRVGIDSSDDFLDHLIFRAIQLGISGTSTHHAIEVRILDMIKIRSDKPANADVSQLLGYMRAAAAKADYAYPTSGKHFVAMVA